MEKKITRADLYLASTYAYKAWRNCYFATFNLRDLKRGVKKEDQAKLEKLITKLAGVQKEIKEIAARSNIDASNPYLYKD